MLTLASTRSAENMKIELLVSRLCTADRAPLLMFDYDGTLAPFVVERDRAVPYPAAKRLLEELHVTTSARIVIISGREVEEVVRLLKMPQPVEVWGCHGWERLTATEQRITGEMPAGSRRLLSELRKWMQAEGLTAHAEEKPASLALHWRGMDAGEQSVLERKAYHKWEQMMAQKFLHMHHFDGGLEWRLPNWSKADAVKTLLAEVPSGTPLAYFGDDLTDEDAFCALPAGGVPILVRGEKRPSAAQIWLRPPEELCTFLEMLLKSLRGHHGDCR